MIGRIAALWLIGIVLSALVISCCSDEYSINGILNVEVYELQPDSTLIYIELDAVNSPFALVINPDVEILSAYKPELISSAKATACEYNFTNSITSF